MFQMDDADRLFGVVTGDVVGSTKLPPDERQRLFSVMKRGSDELRNFLGEVVPLDVDIYAGDSWQLLVNDPAKALRAALFYRAHVMAYAKEVDTRLAIAVGTIQFLPGNRVSEGDGEAFRLSGRLLKEHRDRRRMRFACGNAALCELWDDIFGLVDALISSAWSQKRARAVTGAIQGHSPASIAARDSVSESNISSLLEKAGWAAVQRIITQFENSEIELMGGVQKRLD
jgi:hypothetical protein